MHRLAEIASIKGESIAQGRFYLCRYIALEKLRLHRDCAADFEEYWVVRIQDQGHERLRTIADGSSNIPVEQAFRIDFCAGHARDGKQHNALLAAPRPGGQGFRDSGKGARKI